MAAQGIVILEIAHWKLIDHFEQMKREKLDPKVLREELLTEAKKVLPHRVGQNFTDAIVACLEFQELTKELDDFHRHQEYRGMILDKLESAAKGV